MISIIVVSYNVAARLRRCLTSVADAAEIVVVDNASEDGSVQMVQREFPHVRLLARPTNEGFSTAVNRGARHSSQPLLLVLNPDTELSPLLLNQMEETMAARDDVWAMGFRQVDDAGRFQLSFGPPPSLALELVRRTVQRRLDAGGDLLGPLLSRIFSRPMPMPWVSGAALLVRRSAFSAVGGFDERFFLYFEDIDFCLRLWRAGGKVLYDPSLVIRHSRGASADTARGLAQRAYRESQLYFWQKHRGAMVRALVWSYLRLRGLSP